MATNKIFGIKREKRPDFIFSQLPFELLFEQPARWSWRSCASCVLNLIHFALNIYVLILALNGVWQIYAMKTAFVCSQNCRNRCSYVVSRLTHRFNGRIAYWRCDAVCRYLNKMWFSCELYSFLFTSHRISLARRSCYCTMHILPCREYAVANRRKKQRIFWTNLTWFSSNCNV